MPTLNRETLQQFLDSYNDRQIRDARFSMLDTIGSSLRQISERLEVSGFVTRDSTIAGVAILARLASDLVNAISTLLAQGNVYPAAGLLRQLIEIEYLLFLGYKDSETIGQWFDSDSQAIRNRFNPQSMRNESEGLFRDEEYWLHCDLGGHPNPRAQSLYVETQGISSLCFVIPDSVHHLRRLWTSIKLVIEHIDVSHLQLQSVLHEGSAAVTAWESIENETILQFDGITA